MALSQKGADVVTLGNLSSGHRDAVLLHGRFVHGDIADRLILDKVFREYKFDSVIQTARRVVGKTIPVQKWSPRRLGDPARLVADANKTKAELSWQPTYADLDAIVKHTWQWEYNHALRFAYAS